MNLKRHNLFCSINIFAAVCAMTLLQFSCAHQPDSADDTRAPSSVSYSEINKCGELSYSEDSRNAVDSDDLFYNLKIDCSSDGVVNKDDKQRVISFPLNQLQPQQKAWITRWKRQVVRQKNNARANPFVCAQLLAVEDPCSSGKNVLGYSPKFTLKK